MKKFAFVVLATITPFFFACWTKRQPPKLPIAVAAAKVSVVANQAMEKPLKEHLCDWLCGDDSKKVERNHRNQQCYGRLCHQKSVDFI